MKTNDQIITVPYNVLRDCTLKQWVDYLGKDVPENKKLSVSDFLSLKDKNGVTNLDCIWNQYNPEQKKKYEQDYANKSLPDTAPVITGTPTTTVLSKMELEFSKMSKQGQFMSQGSFEAFWSENYEKIIQSIGYKPEYTETNENASLDVRIVPQSIRVWIYVNSLGKIIDISPFIIACNTNKVAMNGAFSIRLSTVGSQSSPVGFGNGFVENFNTTNTDGVLTKSFWEKFINQNDLVFIRFEKLLMEKDASLKGKADSLEVSTNELVNGNSNYNIWDMIGFVDICTVTYSAEYNTSFVDLAGRDFSKLFVEDGSYFMPLKWVEGSEDRWFYGGDEADAWFKRNVVTGNYNYFFNYGFKRIRETLWFIINILSNIGIVPDELFGSYKERRTKAYEIEDDDGVYKTQEVKGVWQILKVFVEDQLDDRSIVDPSFANPDGTLMSFVGKICQPPFVEVLFDTYVDTLDIVVRQPPFTEKAIEDVIKKKTYIEIDSNNLVELSLSYDDRAYSWYQLFPQNNFVGTRMFTSLAFIPIIYFEEFTKIWGNKKQQIQDMYISLSAISGVGGTQQLNSMAAAALNDLLFVIETNVYLPFTRKGVISIKGDRRVKVGTFIKCNATNELFYVVGVTQSIVFSQNQLERVTRIQVERGMYFPILTGNNEGKDINLTTSSGDKASYFKIARLQKIKEDIRKAEAATQDENKKINGSKQAIDSDQFDYFFKRRMYNE